MALFKNMLGSGESLFRDPVPLDYDFIPKLVPYREAEQRQIALCIKPLIAERTGRNIFIHGPPGIGKTVVLRHIMKELEETDETCDAVIPFYINCWQKNSSFKVILEMCEKLEYKFTHNKRGDELFKIVKDLLNKKAAVFVLDEVDKLEDTDLLYQLLEEIYRKSIILVTNHKTWLAELDQRIKSRLVAEILEFRPYTKEQVVGILRDRMKYSFVPDVWQEEAFLQAADKAYTLGDVRSGLYLLKEAGNAAEDAASRSIMPAHMAAAVKKLEEFSIKKKDALEDESRFILDLIKKCSGQKIGDIFKKYQEEGGAGGYKTFQRKINKLAENKYLNVQKVGGGPDGNTTMITFSPSGVTTLDDFK
ncbi:MAG: AAA family ATPase [Candidatus Woesearchaeota archaeon]|nr:AAA family ATPase [Candidatus Woesearchaeota archaeon]